MASAGEASPLLNTVGACNAETPPGVRPWTRHGESVLLPEERAEGANAMGTFSGVVMPNTLGVFGVIIFLRLSWACAQSGLLLFLVIMTAAYSVAGLTVLSLMSISTNGRVRGGGCYFMISRALGPEFGGAIGLIFYAANIAGCGLYLVGLSDALISAFDLPGTRWHKLAYGSAVLLLVTVVCLVGAKAYAKTGIFIFVLLWAIIAVVLGSIFFRSNGSVAGYTGFSRSTLHHNLYPDFQAAPAGAGAQSFQSVFAVYMPTTTGLLAGSNMSGDLADAARSLPRGTFIAVVLTYVTYALLAVSMAATIQRSEMLENYYVVQDICISKYIVTAGIVCSTVSSALGNQIGGSRIVQALARDKLFAFLKPFAYGAPGSDEPRYGVLLSMVLIQALLFVGDLNTLAKITTSCFLISFVIINFACFVLSISGTPNYRPSFTGSNAFTTGLGTVVCLGTMFFVDVVYAGVSLGFLVILLIYVHWTAPPLNWGFISQALMYHQVRKYLLRLDVRKNHVKYWRPQFLYLCANPTSSLQVLDFVNNLKKGGLYVVGHILVGDVVSQGRRYKQQVAAWREFIADTKIKAFSETLIAPSVRAGARSLLEVSGLGALQPNTLIMGFFDTSTSMADAQAAGLGPDDLRSTVSLRGPALSGRREFVSAARRHFAAAFREPTSASAITLAEYVGIINDALFFNKNVVITRNFERLDKELIVTRALSRFGAEPQRSASFFSNMYRSTTAALSRSRKINIDLWPIDVSGTSQFDHSFTLLLLFGWILQLTDIWSKFTRLRVFSIIHTGESKDAERERIELMLRTARIDAEVIPLELSEAASASWFDATPPSVGPEWANADRNSDGDDVEPATVAAAADEDARIGASSARTSTAYYPYEDEVHDGVDRDSDAFQRLLLVRYSIVNQLMRAYSAEAGVIFSTFDRPSVAVRYNTHFLAGLDALTRDLPPILCLYGIGTFLATEM
ncbi:solute carrier family 12 member 9 [Thecamonas trahens ATCC 50062]|uniref:Solute carrier family 12 member 9 n=1 Tax=Thecamonas trahens ATCC 50062 TaxID=461836 RepID=A0A0L0DQH8_THETB|nr:solute carrier family 12 member 9 [Thecamonas trahens ATCC 50062]KNC53668.1 solute carrier family 12 member 9 [Thecamonas trahens ATCC 50062]|eukprot:XP_013761982.1 solute carrier family 12 member 9 [Thecamonas trahens ATCC 50062]